MEMKFNYNSLRARNARRGKLISKPLMLVILMLMVIGLVSFGVSLLVMKSALG